ncbi:pilus assembly protein PilM, partial [bacterium]|nr:pilus assembly protein PilM [bacterium]
MAHRILGLDIGAHRVKGTLIETSWRNFEVLQVAEVRVDPAAEPPVAPVPEPEPDFHTPDAADAETAEDTDSDAAARPEEADEDEESPEAPPPGFVSAVRKLVNRPGMEFDEVVCAISGHWVSTRIVQLPFTSRKKIDSVLGPQVEDEVPFDMDEMILAYEILDASKEGSTILAALAKREDVRRFLHWVEAAGLDPKVLSMTSSALAVAAVSAHPTRIGGYAVLDIGADSTDIVVVNGARVVQVRTIPTGGTHVTAELARLASLDMDKASRLKEEVGKILGDADAVADERVTRLSDTLIAAHQNLLGRLRQT